MSITAKTTKRPLPLKLRRTQSNKERLAVGEYLLKSLAKLGVKHIFGTPGPETEVLVKMIEHHPQIQFIRPVQHESAGLMADAYARFRGLGCLLLNHDLALNSSSLIKSAFLENSPLVIIEGLPDYEHSVESELHFADENWNASSLSRDFLCEWTSAQIVIDDPHLAARKINSILDHCLYYKKPVYIELPESIVSALIPTPQPHHTTHAGSNSVSLKQSIASTARLLEHSKSPLFVIGHKVCRHKLGATITELAETLRVPMVTTLMAKSVIDENHPHFYGIINALTPQEEVRYLMKRTDCIVALGVSDKEIPFKSLQMSGAINTIIVDSRGVHANQHHFPHVALKDYIESLQEQTHHLKFNYPKIHKSLPDTFDSAKDTPISACRFIECLQHYLTSNHVLITEHGKGLNIASHLYVDCDGFLSSSSFLTKGFALPASIALQLVEKQKRMISLMTPDQFQLTMTELALAASLTVDPIIIVIDPISQEDDFSTDTSHSSTVHQLDYAALPKLFRKGIAVCVATEKEFENTLQAALETRGQFYAIRVKLNDGY